MASPPGDSLYPPCHGPGDHVFGPELRRCVRCSAPYAEFADLEPARPPQQLELLIEDHGARPSRGRRPAGAGRPQWPGRCRTSPVRDHHDGDERPVPHRPGRRLLLLRLVGRG